MRERFDFQNTAWYFDKFIRNPQRSVYAVQISNIRILDSLVASLGGGMPLREIGRFLRRNNER